MDWNAIYRALHDLGLDNVVPVLLAVTTLARAVDALIAQPAPGSHWLPLRKLLSIAGLGVGNAQPADQPPIVTWLQRLARAIMQASPPPSMPRVEPTLGPGSIVTPKAAAPAAPASVAAATASPAASLLAQARSALGAAPTDAVTFRKPGS